MNKTAILLGFLLFPFCGTTQAQDTVKVSLQQFIKRGVENSGQVSYERQNVALAANRVDQAQSKRYLPKFELNTQHGVVPGVVSQADLPKDEFYLDPELENDWENWAVFTRAEVNAVQPIFSWGALRNVVQAAKSGAEAAKNQFEAQKAGIEIRLYELYQSYLLTQEIKRLLDEAQSQINKIEKQIDGKQEEGDSDLDESEVFKFKVFKSEFGMRAAEVRENSSYIRNVWNYVLQAEKGVVYEPDMQFLDPVANPINELTFYRTRAVEFRPEINAIESGIHAAEYGLKATKSQNYPTLFLGLTGSYANTPNRPRQSNPFIINNTNYASAGVGVGIRQNLDFFGMKTKVDESKIQLQQAKYLRRAAVDGIVLQINEKYKDASLSKTKVDKTDEALVISKKWLRQEQLDYDFGIGETKDLMDALRKELELRLQLKRQTFEFNKDMAELFNAAGLPLEDLKVSSE